MKPATRKLSEMQLRAEPHVQASIEKMLNEDVPPEPQQPAATPIEALPEPESVKPQTMRLNVDVDAEIYNEVFIKARRQGKRMSEVVRSLLVEYLSR